MAALLKPESRLSQKKKTLRAKATISRTEFTDLLIPHPEITRIVLAWSDFPDVGIEAGDRLIIEEGQPTAFNPVFGYVDGQPTIRPPQPRIHLVRPKAVDGRPRFRPVGIVVQICRRPLLAGILAGGMLAGLLAVFC
jgi:hypothetical protein